jgi:hypothetical protein
MYDDSWEGDADALARATGKALADCGIVEDPLPNERLVRDYVQRGIVSRPERRKKDAIYGRRQLLEMVAARVLVGDGWPLAKISQHIPNATEAELLALIPLAKEENPALAVTRRLRFERGAGTSRQRFPPDPSLAAPNFNQRVARGTRLQAELRSALHRLGMDPDAPAVEQLTLIAIAPWCQVLVESDRLQRVTADEAEEVGRAVTAILLDPAIRRGGK